MIKEIIRGTSCLLILGLTACGGGGGGGSSPSPSTSVTALTSGVEVTGSVASGQWMYYSIEVPANSAVDVELVANTGEVDLVVNHAEKPTTAMWEADTEDCSDWSIAGQYSATCYVTPPEGTTYVGAWGNNVESFTGDPGGNYTLVAVVTSYDYAMKPSTRDQSEMLRFVADQYMKSLGGKRTNTTLETYPTSGIVDIQTGEDHHRFYFGSDAVTPAVLSVDHNGVWTHYYTWEAFEADLANR